MFPGMKLSDSDSDWVILNFNVTGYYRVNYDELGWKKLSEQLEKDPKVWAGLGVLIKCQLSSFGGCASWRRTNIPLASSLPPMTDSFILILRKG